MRSLPSLCLLRVLVLGLLPLVHGFVASPTPGFRLQPRTSRRGAPVMAALPRREMLGAVVLSAAAVLTPRAASAAAGDAERDQWKRAVADIDKLATNYGTATRGWLVQPPPPPPPPFACRLSPSLRRLYTSRKHRRSQTQSRYQPRAATRFASTSGQWAIRRCRAPPLLCLRLTRYGHHPRLCQHAARTPGSILAPPSWPRSTNKRK